ncbi:hypothetical protein [Psychroserpens sp. MEBiC05023]
MFKPVFIPVKRLKCALPLLGLLIHFCLLSCNSNDDSNTSEEEEEDFFITTVELIMVPEGDGDTITSTSYDPDSWDGPTPGPSATSGVGEFNTTYVGSVRFLNERVDPPIDYTQQIIDNGIQYQVTFGTITGGTPFSYEYLPPFDSNGEPLGINFKIHSSDENCGVLFLYLNKIETSKLLDVTGLGGSQVNQDVIAGTNTLIECNYED